MAKVTKRENFEAVVEVLSGVEGTEALVEFVEKEIGLLVKRSGGERKPTATQAANEDTKAFILETVLTPEGLTATEVAVATEVTVQKASQLLRQMVAEGAVTKTDAKGKAKATFAVAA